jgi:hypothetical protein
MQTATRTLTRTLSIALLAWCALATSNDSFAGSAASLSGSIGSLSTSVGSSSTSFQKSSDSSFGLVAQGPYEVTDMVAMDDQPGYYRLSLRALQAGVDNMWLILPREAAQKGQIKVGTIVHAQAREYGVAFEVHNEAGEGRPFFLVLRDDWFRELDSRLVTM